MKYRLLSSMYYEDTMVYEAQYRLRYNSESTYRYNFSIGENKAFVVINVNLLDSISQIYKLDKHLSRKILQVPSIAETQYTKRCMIDEIKMTNDIEGVISTRKEINELMDNLLTENKSKRLYGLVKKYVMLSHDDLSLKTCSDIRSIYDELVLKEVEEENPTHRPDGLIFRKEAVFVQSKTGKQIHTGLQPESRIIDVMTECLKMLTDEQYNPLISIAVFHYMFGYVHPFYDGNGRVSRFISSYLIAKELQPILSYRISYSIKKTIDEYYKQIRIVNDPKNKGELTSFVDYFLQILLKSLDDVNQTIDDGLVKLNYTLNLLPRYFEENEKDQRVMQVLNALVQNSLFGEIGLSVNDIVKLTNIGQSKVRSALAFLERKNLVTSKKWSKKLIYDANLSVLGTE